MMLPTLARYPEWGPCGEEHPGRETVKVPVSLYRGFLLHRWFASYCLTPYNDSGGKPAAIESTVYPQHHDFTQGDERHRTRCRVVGSEEEAITFVDAQWAPADQWMREREGSTA